MKKYLKKGDIIILVSMLLIAVLIYMPLWFQKDQRVEAKIYEEGKILHEILLSTVETPYEIKVHGGRIRVEKDRIAYIKGDCPDQICVHTGWLSKAGEVASCVPNKTVIQLVSSDEKNLDGITY